ncbi:hypothetical protein [Streptomyces sp. ICC1]|uniref:hypothetical protein n=1 Tax=Streptomyces sp. ICC1 TaxID=2099583 RepID=UPI000DC75559|nr:hypothetical protein [Streptomyces sp. ICC1]AWZ15904.1 hypothetical protein DRB96_30700 [Streptomyces sp. ICC1]
MRITPDDPAWEAKRRRAGIAAFLTGAAASLAFFAFFPGLPHVIDWGAILTSLAVGGLARRARQVHMTRARKGTTPE